MSYDIPLPRVSDTRKFKFTTGPKPAFHRSKLIRNIVAAALAIPDREARRMALEKVPEYRSRGKGWRKGGFFKNCLSRTQNPKPSGWDPHTGEKQVAKGLKRIGAWLS